MRLHEYQSKLLFSKFGIPIPKGKVTNTASDVKQIAQELGGRVVIKAQVLIGGRGKAGGIRLAKTPEEAQDLATMILAMELKGLPVRKVLVDEAVSISKELYLGITNDRNKKRAVVMASAAGGVEIEEVAQQDPEKIIKIAIDPFLGLREFQARDLAIGIDLPKDFWKSFIDTAIALWRAYQNCDASLAEINPLVITADQKLLALDGKMVVDDNALFRHPDLVDMRDLDIEAPGEIEARKYGLSFIKLDGEIGCLVNGAGLAMATMDIIKLFKGSPANFLDIGGGAGSEKVAAALRIILTDPKVKCVLVNIFGGITRCDEVANGILTALSELKVKTPLVVRLVGTNAKEAMEILADAKLIVCETLEEAAKTSVQLIKGKKI
jgi:succinyl-CoA synthetase beta subunit